MASRRYRLVVVDDHVLFRRGVVGLLSDMGEFEVVGEAGDGMEALSVIERTQPDIILLDVNMPRLDGIALVQALRRQKDSPRILMLTISQDDNGEFENGGTSYLILSHVPFSELGLPDLPETPVNEVSEKVMEMTIPFAVGWGAVLTAVTAGVALYEKNQESKTKAAAEKKAEASK